MQEGLIAKYGTPRAARYFVKSLEDLLDVVETVYKQLTQQAQGEDLSALLSGIECFAVQIPRTLSSHIIGFSIPEHILECDNRSQPMSSRIPELKLSSDSQPKVIHNANRTIIAKEIRTFADIIIFQKFFTGLMTQNSDGIKAFTTKRAAEIRTEPLNGSDGYTLTVCFPGTLFKSTDLQIGQ